MIENTLFHINKNTGRRRKIVIKMRLQGTKNDIRWFLKDLEKDKRFDLVDTSDFYQIKTSNRFKRLYTNVYRNQISTKQDI
jgi:hypothetical protein